MLEVVLSKCLYIPVNREEPCKSVHSISSGLSSLGSVGELGTGEGGVCRDIHCKVHCSRRQAPPSRSELSPEANPADLPSELPGPLFLVQDGLRSRGREEEELLSVPCLPAWPGAGTSF